MSNLITYGDKDRPNFSSVVTIDIGPIVRAAISEMNWSRMAHLALREIIQEMVRAIDFKPLIKEAVALYVKESLEEIDICGIEGKEYVKKLASDASFEPSKD